MGSVGSCWSAFVRRRPNPPDCWRRVPTSRGRLPLTTALWQFAGRICRHLSSARPWPGIGPTIGAGLHRRHRGRRIVVLFILNQDRGVARVLGTVGQKPGESLWGFTANAVVPSQGTP